MSDIKCPTRGDCIHGQRCLLNARCIDPLAPPTVEQVLAGVEVFSPYEEDLLRRVRSGEMSDREAMSELGYDGDG